MIISLATIDFGGGGGSSAKIQPKKQEEYTANGSYSVNPDEGYDGLEGVDVTVAIPTEEGDFTYQDNGSYTAVPSTGKYFSQVNIEVDVPLQDNQTVDITKNGSYTITPDEGSEALKKATVNVKTPAIGDKKSITYSANGTYTISPDEGDGGIEGADVTVNVPEKNIQEMKIVNQDVETSGLYVFQPDEGYDGMKTLRANLTIPATPATTIDVGGLEMGLGYSKFASLPSVFDFSNVTSYRGMFYKCDKLTSLTADLTNSTDNTDMTQGCTALTNLTLNGSLNKTLFLDTCPLTEESMVNVLDAAYNTTNPTEKKNLVFKYRYVQDDEQNTILTKYNDCVANKGWKISGMNLTVPPSMYEDYVAIWDGGGKITGNTSTNPAYWGGTALSDSPYMKASDTEWTKYHAFKFPTSITSYTWLDFSNVTSMYGMFSGCTSLVSLDLSNFNTSNVTSMGNMFNRCSKLTSLDLSNFNTDNVIYMGGMFYNCSGLTSLDLSSFNTSNVTNMGDMFNSCSKLTSLDLSNFNTSKVTSMNSMFNDCYALKTVKVTNCDDATIEKIKSILPSSSLWTLADGVLTRP